MKNTRNVLGRSGRTEWWSSCESAWESQWDGCWKMRKMKMRDSSHHHLSERLELLADAVKVLNQQWKSSESESSSDCRSIYFYESIIFSFLFSKSPNCQQVKQRAGKKLSSRKSAHHNWGEGKWKNDEATRKFLSFAENSICTFQCCVECSYGMVKRGKNKLFNSMKNWSLH